MFPVVDMPPVDVCTVSHLSSSHLSSVPGNSQPFSLHLRLAFVLPFLGETQTGAARFLFPRQIPSPFDFASLLSSQRFLHLPLPVAQFTGCA